MNDAPGRLPRVLAIASHPIQYQAPWFRALAQTPGIDFSVLFIQRPSAAEQGRGFGVAFQWDIPVLEGYRWSEVPRLRGSSVLGGFFATRILGPHALLRALEPEVILLTGWHVWPLLQLLLAARRAAIPVIMRGEANALRKPPVLARLLHRQILARCDAFLPIGRSSRDFYRQYDVPDAALFDAPYFVDNERFSAAAQGASREGTRDRWAIPHGVVCCCYAGKLEPKKRILDLLEALRIARDGGAALHLLVVGTGELLTAAKDFVAAHRLPVSFTGFLNQSEIPAAYAATDCLVLPSDHGETWGLVVNEAMACGKPAIVSDRVGCGPDLVTPGVTGELTPFGEPAALAAHMARLAADPQLLRDMGARARERVSSHYRIEDAVEGTLRAISRVLKTP